ncbi:MAG: hypothetical protein Q7S20_12260 [Gemmatimonadaceae bacterium]|nr:hypothetical protein [Gemmatimonadaceae bacterium]
MKVLPKKRPAEILLRGSDRRTKTREDAASKGFWQTSQEVEEEKLIGRRRVVDRIGASKFEIQRRKLDVGIGTFASNVAMYFIILTTSLTPHSRGLTHFRRPL